MTNVNLAKYNIAPSLFTTSELETFCITEEHENNMVIMKISDQYEKL